MSRRLRLRLPIRRKDNDILSSLPDEILEHIVSYLPTKDAVATSFLTKRWKLQSLWHFPDAFAFRQFFYSVVTKRDNTLPILSFQLNCRRHGFYHETDFYNAVYAATSQGVENLSIDLCHRPLDMMMTLPTFALTTKTLSVLKLKRVKLAFGNDFVVDLPSLKLLHLESVCFKYYQLIIKLLSSCPILEDLEAKDLTINYTTFISRGSHVLSLPNLVGSNVSSSPIIKLDCFPNIHHLRIQASRRYCFDGTLMFHNLTYMELAFKLTEPPGLWKWNRLTKFLQKSPKLQTLIIDEINDNIICNCNGGKWRQPTTVPECLSSHLTTCTIRNYSCFNCGFQFAKYIMQNSRVLSTMTIQSSKSVDTDTKLQMLKELSLCPMISATCKLLFS